MQLRPLCTNQVAVNGNGWEGEAAAIRCKRWSCPSCAEVNKRKIIHIAKSARPRALLTLTVSSEHYATPDDAAQALKRGLRLLRLRLQRHEKLVNFSFLAVFEKHESGYPHLHLLIRGKFIPWRWLRTAWEEITGSIHVDIRRISSIGQAAMYCAKYIAKELAAFEGCKRWWRSHDYSDEADPDYQEAAPHARWTRHGLEFGQMPLSLHLVGYKVERSGVNRLRYRWPPDQGPPPGWLWAASGGKSR